MKIMCVISTMQAGGAERVMAWLCRSLSLLGHGITLICLDKGDQPPAYALPDSVKVIYMDVLESSNTVLAAIRANFFRVYKIRSVIRNDNPDAIISFMHETNVIVLLSNIGTGIPAIVSEHTTPVRRTKLFWSVARSIVYLLADRITVLSEYFKAHYVRWLQYKIVVIPNPVIPVAASEIGVTSTERKRILAVGRLVELKGFDVLIHAFTEVASLYPEWDVVILGAGPEFEKLNNLIEELGLLGRITLVGYVEDVVSFYRACDIFVLSSRIEGFPMVLLEAMLNGLPVIATDCSEAINEIVENGVNGIVVPPDSVESLRDALVELISNEPKMREFGTESCKDLDRYCEKSIIDGWGRLLMGVTDEKS